MFIQKIRTKNVDEIDGRFLKSVFQTNGDWRVTSFVVCGLFSGFLKVSENAQKLGMICGRKIELKIKPTVVNFTNIL